MAKVDGTDPSLYMNPSAYSQLKHGKADDKKSKGIRGSGKTEFSNLFNELRGKTADQIGQLRDMPVSEESVNILMDEVRDTGDRLKSRPLPEEIMNYKQAVRNFINYVVQNCYTLDYEEGIKNKYKPGYKGRRSSPAAEDSKGYTKISVIDKKLEDLAAMLLSSQAPQMELVSRLEEIRGLLIDLLQ
ncbi:MAG: YaaR family protein [Treponema sp.]|nr:YaaR family protein [Treponema sp.]